jgi:hypothetical protein
MAVLFSIFEALIAALLGLRPVPVPVRSRRPR